MEFSLFAGLEELSYGLSEKSDGSLRLSDNPAIQAEVDERRAKFFPTVGLSVDQVVSAGLVHGADVRLVDKSLCGQIVPLTDALITSAKDVCLCVTVADCFPVYFYDPAHQTIALAHCGWRGTFAGLAEQTVRTMRTKCGSDPSDILVGIGPGLQSCHFKIGDDVKPKFAKYLSSMGQRGSSTFVDLADILRRQLMSLGVEDTHIESTDICTFDEPGRYFSYRRDKPAITEAMAAFMVLR